MDNIETIKQRLEAAREKSRAQTSSENTAAVKALQAELGAAIADGADPCPDCGAPPHGVERKHGVDAHGDVPAQVITSYEVGCLVCPGRSRAKTQRAAVILWNAREYT